MKLKALKRRFRNVRENAGRWAFAAVLILLLILFITGDTGFYAKLRLLRRKHQLEKKIIAAQERQAYLEQKIDSLKNDPKTIEKEIREGIGMGKKDEVIITFENP